MLLFDDSDEGEPLRWRRYRSGGEDVGTRRLQGPRDRRTAAEVVITVETTVDVAGCATCGTRAEPQDRKRTDIRDLPCFGRPARLVWIKRRWRCADPDCESKTWTEESDCVPPRAVLTVRAGEEATRQVGELAMPVAVVARESGCVGGRS